MSSRKNVLLFLKTNNALPAPVHFLTHYSSKKFDKLALHENSVNTSVSHLIFFQILIQNHACSCIWLFTLIKWIRYQLFLFKNAFTCVLRAFWFTAHVSVINISSFQKGNPAFFYCFFVCVSSLLILWILFIHFCGTKVFTIWLVFQAIRNSSLLFYILFFSISYGFPSFSIKISYYLYCT